MSLNIFSSFGAARIGGCLFHDVRSVAVLHLL